MFEGRVIDDEVALGEHVRDGADVASKHDRAAYDTERYVGGRSNRVDERGLERTLPELTVDQAPQEGLLRLDAPREEVLDRAAAIVADAWRSFDRFRPGQPPVDDLVRRLVEQGLPAEAVERTIVLVDRAEYKRRQAPPGIKVTERAFDRDRRMPITNRFGA